MLSTFGLTEYCRSTASITVNFSSFGPATYNRGPRPRGQGGVDHEFSSEILHHRVLPSGGGGGDANNTNSICSPAEDSKTGLCAFSSSNLRARINTGSLSNNNTDARATCHKRGWKVQGQIAGEWRDRLGRHRRARPTNNANTNALEASGSALAADLSRISSIVNSSCAGSEVSFEGLVDELRERLPRASLLARFVSAQRQNGTDVCPGVEAMVTGTIPNSLDEQREDPLRKHKQGGGSGTRVGGNQRRTAPPVTTSNARARDWSGGSPELQRGEEARGLMPPGCLKLRHPLAGPMRAHASSQPLLRQNSERLNSAAGVGPQPSLVLPPGDMLFSDGSAYRLVATEAVDAENASPSAAMVAAARAQERALPLLQVCAVKVAASTSS